VTHAHGREVNDMNNPNSILDSVKKSIGIEPDYHPFDDEIIMDINTILGVLNQLGVGTIGFTIEDNTATWDEFMAPEAEKEITINEVKTYVSKRVQILFDPPTSGIYMDALKNVISELEFRINVAVETPIHED
jgi:hypothetical protein